MRPDRLPAGGLGLAGVQPVALVLDLRGDTRQRLAVLPPVVRAEQQFSPSREHDAHVCLGATTVAQVQRSERLQSGHSSGHVASLASYHRRAFRAVLLLFHLLPQTRGRTMTFPATAQLRQQRTAVFHASGVSLLTVSHSLYKITLCVRRRGW